MTLFATNNSNAPGSTSDWQGTPGSYSTNFQNNIDGKVEHFDVYGEVQTIYSQVNLSHTKECCSLVYNTEIHRFIGQEIHQSIYRLKSLNDSRGKSWPSLVRSSTITVIVSLKPICFCNSTFHQRL